MAQAAPTKMTFLKVTGALMVLLALTAAASFLPVGRSLHVLIALTIAFAKMALIMLFFMHVRYSSRITALFAVTGFFWLVILFTLTFGDYMTRITFTVPYWQALP